MVSLRVLQTICGLKQQHPCLYRAMIGSMEDPVFAKQNDRDSAARPLTDFATEKGLQSPSAASCRLRVGRRSAKGCAGASASFQLGTASRYQMWLPVNGFLDTDNAQDQRREVFTLRPSGTIVATRWILMLERTMQTSMQSCLWYFYR